MNNRVFHSSLKYQSAANVRQITRLSFNQTQIIPLILLSRLTVYSTKSAMILHLQVNMNQIP